MKTTEYRVLFRGEDGIGHYSNVEVAKDYIERGVLAGWDRSDYRIESRTVTTTQSDWAAVEQQRGSTIATSEGVVIAEQRHIDAEDLGGEEEDMMIFGWVATCVRADLPPSVFGPFVHEYQAVEEVQELDASGCEGKHEVSAIEVPFTGGATTSLTVTRRNGGLA